MQCKVFNLRMSEDHRASDETDLNTFLHTVNVVSTASALVNADERFWSVLVFYESSTCPSQVDNPQSTDAVQLSSSQEQLYEKLRQWRSKLASTEGVPAYVIAHNESLKQMVALPIKTKDDLVHLKQFGARRVERYGDSILALLAAHQAE